MPALRRILALRIIVPLDVLALPPDGSLTHQGYSLVSHPLDAEIEDFPALRRLVRPVDELSDQGSSFRDVCRARLQVVQEGLIQERRLCHQL